MLSGVLVFFFFFFIKVDYLLCDNIVNVYLLVCFYLVGANVQFEM